MVDRTVLRLLKRLGYSLQANQKTREGADHPDRDAQFRAHQRDGQGAIEARQPVISVDTKKRELIGDFKAVGRELEPKGSPKRSARTTSRTRTRTRDPLRRLDLTRDEGWVNVGSSATPRSSRSHTILGWWENLGSSATRKPRR